MAHENGTQNGTAEKAKRAREIADQALENLTKALDQGKSESLTVYLAAIAKFHRYSFGNILLIASQRPDASRVAGYRTWQTLDRFVKHGEKGILIFAPMLLKKRTNEDQLARSTDADQDGEKILRFRAVYVFDVSQTDGKPLPEHATVNGDAAGYTDRLKAFVSSRGIQLEYADTLGSAEGLSTGGKIVLLNGLSSAQELSVLAHELAHEMLHHGEGAQRGTKTVRETEAEAVAFVVSQAVGLDTNTAASDYIQLYAGDKDTLAASLDRIQQAASTIIAAITASNEADE